jgi:S-adenosyl-L-methionine hydrolase (adenosine-forming)
MAILLFTDFGSNDLYVGQVKSVFERYAPGVAVIDLLHEAPAFDPRASAHLLAALAARLPRGAVIMGVVDPGVGSERGAVVLRTDGRWYVGPDNGLFSIVAARAATRAVWRLTASAEDASPSFHGRDVFAPLAAAVATDDFPNESVEAAAHLEVMLPADDLAEIVYIDHYGNAFTGLRAHGHDTKGSLAVNGVELPNARVFSAVPRGTAFWYENSLGLVEIAVNADSARTVLGLAIGTPVAWTG